MDISSAFETLRSAVLHSHGHEAIEPLQEIEARLRELDPSIRAFTAVANGSDSREAVSESASVQIPSPVEPLTLSGQTKIDSSHSRDLVTALNKISSWVWKSTNLSPGKVLGIKRPRVCDRRLEDIRRIEGEPKAGPQYKLLRVLAQRSLVIQGENSGYLNIDNYCELASLRETGKANKGRRGKIASYVREELAVEEEDKNFAIRAISAGIKQLVTERLLKRRMEGAEQYGSASGISAFTALVVRPFRYLKYEEIPEFLDCFLETGSMNLPALRDKDDSVVDGTEVKNPKADDFLPVSIAEVIQVSSAWFDKLQVYYNRFLNIHENFDEHQPNRRTRMRLNSTNNSNESPPFSDRLSTIGSSSPTPGENGSIHHRRSSLQESSDLNEVLDHPGPSFSGSLNSTSPNTTCVPNMTQIQTTTSSSVQVPESCTSDSNATLSRIDVWTGIPLAETTPAQGLQTNPFYDPRFDAQPFDPLYDPRFDAQPFDPLYDPRFDAQPFDPLYDPRFYAQPFEPLLQPVSDPQFDAQSGHVEYPSPRVQSVTEKNSVQNVRTGIDSQSPSWFAFHHLPSPHNYTIAANPALHSRTLESLA